VRCHYPLGDPQRQAAIARDVPAGAAAATEVAP